MFSGLLNVAGDFLEDPIGAAVDITMQPVRDALDVLDGLSEGELRQKAVISLGADVAGGMVLSELVDWYSE